MKRKLFFIFLIILLMIPSVSAASDSYYFRKIINLLYDMGEYIADTIIEAFLDLMSSALKPLLRLTRDLLRAKVSLRNFRGIWRLMATVVSFFYSLFFIYAGLKFITSGNDPAKRANAKLWLKNTFVMIILVGGSYYFYDLILELASELTESILRMVSYKFFYVTYDNFYNFSMELMFTSIYVLILLFTIFVLAIRYVFASIGVVFTPIGVFLYFLPPLKSYGKLILNSLGIMAFIPFIDAVIILASSELLYASVFRNMQILVKIVAFLLINFTTIMLMRLAVTRSAFDKTSGGMKALIKYVI